MKKDKYKAMPIFPGSVADVGAEQEQLGRLIAQRVMMLEQTNSPCLTPEEMAQLVEGTTTKTAKDNALKHLASCATCYDTYVLTQELYKADREKNTVGLVAKKKRLLPYRTMALAATVVIMVLSLYIFFTNSEIPKSARQVVAPEESMSTEKIALPSADLAPEPTPAPMKEAKKEEPLTKRNTTPKVMADDGLRGAIETDHAKTKEQNENPPTTEIKQEPERLKNTADENLSETTDDQEKTVDKTEPKGEAAKKDSRTRNAYSARPIQQQPVNVAQNVMPTQVNQPRSGNEPKNSGSVIGIPEKPAEKTGAGLEQIRNTIRAAQPYLKTTELMSLFADTLEFAKQLKEETTLSFAQVQERIQPMLHIVVVGQVREILPDITYFISISQPGSVAFRFFNLLLSGWCVQAGTCWGADNLVPAWEKKPVLKQELLPRWEELLPQLSGLFKEIAYNTIAHLKQ